LARNYFRYFEKKRGHRRTGSRTLGSLGEAVFFALLLVLGCGGILAGIFWLVIPEWRLHHGFEQAACLVLQKKLGEKEGSSATLYRPEIKIQYEVYGKQYSPWTYDINYQGDRAYSSDREAAAAALEPFVEGQKYPCWYDPAQPDVAVLVRGYQGWLWLVFLVPGSFVAIGAGGLLYTVLRWGKSAERRAATVQRAQPIELFDLDRPRGPKLPNVPDLSDITSSPGTKLAYRLPLSHSPGWTLLGLAAACLLWNGSVSYFTVAAVRSHLARQPDWLLTLFILPFLVIGIALIVCFVRQLVVATGVGPTLVEISDHPLLPGGEYRLLVSQSGRLDMRSLEVWLACREEATYRQGTNARTETREVRRLAVFRREAVAIRPGERFQAECSVRVPADAMHSFRADHNEIIWSLVVRGDVVGRHAFSRAFPVVVHPLAGASGPGSDGP
jgi:hypothetical protein